jgi:hypothetical protein
MKAIHYDAEGDILSITYSENKKQKQIGVELSDNIVLYYNPEAKTPIKLLILSYGALMQANTQSPLLLDGLIQAPVEVQSIVTAMLKSNPLKTVIQVMETRDQAPLMGRLQEIFTQSTLQTVAAI